MSDPLYDLKLTRDEVLILDGRCSPNSQLIVDRVKLAVQIGEALSPSEADMVARLVDIAKNEQILTYHRESITCCKCCKRSDGYYVVNRSTRFKTKGSIDYDSPKTFSGYNMDFRGVSIQHYMGVGVCDTCAPRVLPVLRAILEREGIKCDTSLIPGFDSSMKRVEIYACGHCGWSGPETLVGKMPALISGYYPGKCPQCKHTRVPFEGQKSDSIKGTGKYQLIVAGLGAEGAKG